MDLVAIVCSAHFLDFSINYEHLQAMNASRNLNRYKDRVTSWPGAVFALLETVVNIIEGGFSILFGGFSAFTVTNTFEYLRESNRVLNTPLDQIYSYSPTEKASYLEKIA